MRLLEQRIITDGIIGENDVLKVGTFLNQQIDVELMSACADEFCRLFKDAGITKVLTVEASGIAIAAITALRLGVQLVFAKKSVTSNVAGAVYSADAYSFTHNHNNTLIVPCAYLGQSDKVLIIDDFLARGEAVNALLDICESAGAVAAGVGILIEKAYQGGGEKIKKRGVRLESLARIASLDVKNGITFEN